MDVQRVFPSGFWDNDPGLARVTPFGFVDGGPQQQQNQVPTLSDLKAVNITGSSVQATVDYVF